MVGCYIFENLEMPLVICADQPERCRRKRAPFARLHPIGHVLISHLAPIFFRFPSRTRVLATTATFAARRASPRRELGWLEQLPANRAFKGLSTRRAPSKSHRAMVCQYADALFSLFPREITLDMSRVLARCVSRPPCVFGLDFVPAYRCLSDLG